MNNEGWQLQNSYEKLPEKFYTHIPLNPVAEPQLVIFNRTLAKELGLNAEALEKRADIFAGNAMPEGAAQLAQSYAGHQFGHFNMLGDGRALLIGEQLTPDGNRVDIQLKGSGKTPYSRRGDGRAALGPMLREVIISEAMFALGVPTTRSLAVATTGEMIQRETELTGAVLTRVASSHLRVATFQFAAQFGTYDDLKALADYTIERHYPEVAEVKNRYVALLDIVVEAQAALVAKWQSIGFVHGVLNTDNVSIAGESIDFGPCAFMNEYDEATVFSSIDRQGRYAFGKQPEITGWNLTRLAESLLPLFADEQEEAIALAEEVLGRYPQYYFAYYMSNMREKLGLLKTDPNDGKLIQALLTAMAKYRADYTNTFRALADNIRPCNDFFNSEEFASWERDWQQALTDQETTFEQVQPMMQASNPAVIPRNHRVEEALQAAVNGDLAPMDELMHVLATPYHLDAKYMKYAELPDNKNPYITYCGT